jgi:hypothetical protein
MIEFRQRQCRAQIECTRPVRGATAAAASAAGAIRVGGRAEKPRLAAGAEQFGLLPKPLARIAVLSSSTRASALSARFEPPSRPRAPR